MSLDLLKIATQFADIISDYKITRFEQAGNSLRLRVIFQLADGSSLHVRETVINGMKLKYAYHWQDKSGKILIRWDNAPDWDVRTFPHHKHAGGQENVESSYERTLVQVLDVIAAALRISK